MGHPQGVSLQNPTSRRFAYKYEDLLGLLIYFLYSSRKKSGTGQKIFYEIEEKRGQPIMTACRHPETMKLDKVISW